jgi:hypothetical protein
MIGNRVFSHSLILCIASALVFAPWGTLSVKPDADRVPPAIEPVRIQGTRPLMPSVLAADARDEAAEARQEMVFGWQGTVALGQVHVAYWAICLCLMIGALSSALNYVGWTRLPSILIFACFGMTASCSLVAVIQHGLLGTVGTGSVLALVCALIGLALSPPDEVAKRTESEAVQMPARRYRSAA